LFSSFAAFIEPSVWMQYKFGMAADDQRGVNKESTSTRTGKVFGFIGL
jgi:hypothetical protein